MRQIFRDRKEKFKDFQNEIVAPLDGGKLKLPCIHHIFKSIYTVKIHYIKFDLNTIFRGFFFFILGNFINKNSPILP